MSVPGMGAMPIEGGFAFRVWAPHAESVGVVGDFNGWDPEAHPLAPEGNGNWYAEVPGAEHGHEYQYVLTNGGHRFMRIDPRARKVTNSVGNGICYDPGRFDWEGDDFTPPRLHETVIYETHIGSFVDSGDDGPADLGDLIGKLDYLVGLGVNAIQLMPLAEFAGDYSWGYNPAHLFAVESSYGGPTALKTFVREAHKKGLAVFIDVVYNHFGPSDLPTWQFDGWSENGKGGIYFYNDHRSETPWGDTRPDYGRREVRDFICDNARMWLREFHADGLRLDMTPYMRRVHGTHGDDIPDGWSMMREVADVVHTEFPRRIVIAEDLHNEAAVTSWEAGGGGMDAQWCREFVHPVRQAITARDDAHRSVAAVGAAMEHRYQHPFDRVIYTESHDEVANGSARISTEVDPANPTGWAAQKWATLGAALVMTAPGVPMLFQGQEFLEDEWFRDTVPLDWERAWAFRDLTQLFRDLVRMRRDLDGDTAALRGSLTEVLLADQDSGVLAVLRGTRDGHRALVAANLTSHASSAAVTLPGGGAWRVRFNSDASVYSQLFGNHVTPDLVADEHGRAVLDLGPASVVVFVPA